MKLQPKTNTNVTNLRESKVTFTPFHTKLFSHNCHMINFFIHLISIAWCYPLHWYVELGGLTLFYPNFTLFWIFTTNWRKYNYHVIILLAMWMNKKVISVYDLVLSKGLCTVKMTTFSWRQPNLIAHGDVEALNPKLCNLHMKQGFKWS